MKCPQCSRDRKPEDAACWWCGIEYGSAPDEAAPATPFVPVPPIDEAYQALMEAIRRLDDEPFIGTIHGVSRSVEPQLSATPTEQPDRDVGVAAEWLTRRMLVLVQPDRDVEVECRIRAGEEAYLLTGSEEPVLEVPGPSGPLFFSKARLELILVAMNNLARVKAKP